jgi:uncharacterized membrane protein
MKNKKNEWGILSLIFSMIGLIIFTIALSNKENSTFLVISISALLLSILGLIFGIIQKKYHQTVFGRIGLIIGMVTSIIFSILIWLYSMTAQFLSSIG